MTGSCEVTLATFTLDCLALDRKNGIRGRVYIGDRRDISSYTTGSNGEVITFELIDDMQMWIYEGENNSHHVMTKSKMSGTKNAMWATTVELNFHAFTAAQMKNLSRLAQLKYAFIAYVTNEGIFKFQGLDKNPQFPSDLFDQRGLKATDGSQYDEGIKLDEKQPFKFTAEGDFYNPGLNFLPTGNSTTIEAIINYFESTYVLVQ